MEMSLAVEFTKLCLFLDFAVIANVFKKNIELFSFINYFTSIICVR